MKITKQLHTIDRPGGAVVAGFLVRGSGADLGKMWFERNEWHWQSAVNASWGTRATMAAAINVLVDTFQIVRGRSATPVDLSGALDGAAAPRLPDAWRQPLTSLPAARRMPAGRSAAAAPAAAAPAAAPAPTRRIVWADESADGLTDAVAAAIQRQGAK